MSIGKYAQELILTTTLTNEQIKDKVREKFPTASTSVACIAWYKSKLRKDFKLAKRGEAPIVVVPTAEPTKEEQVAALRKQLEELMGDPMELEVEEKDEQWVAEFEVA